MMYGTVGEKIQITRESFNMSQLNLAVKVGVSKALMCHWENNLVTPSDNQFKKIAEVFNVEPDWFLEDAEAEIKPFNAAIKDELTIHHGDVATANDSVAAKTIGEKIKYIRKENYLSQGKFAAKIGISESTVSHWEKGKRKPSKPHAKKIIEIFSVPQDWFIEVLDTEMFDLSAKNELLRSIDISTMGGRIKFLRANNEMSISEFAAEFAVLEISVSNWEADKSKPMGPKAMKMAEKFGVSLKWILSGCDDETSQNTDTSTFGGRIKFLRERSKISHRMFASKIGVSSSISTRWEKNYMPSEANLNKVAEFFNVSKFWLRHGIDLENGSFGDKLIDIDKGHDGEFPQTTDTSMLIAQNIKALRKRLNLLQREFGAKIKVAGNTVFRWEKGMHLPSQSYLNQITEVFNLQPDWFLSTSDIAEASLLIVNNATEETSQENDTLESENTAFSTTEIVELPTSEVSSVENIETLAKKANNVEVGTKNYLFALFEMLSSVGQGRLLGYADALCREEMVNEKRLAM